MAANVVPDYAAPLTGWRFWKIRKTTKDGVLWLKSVIRSTLWPPMQRFEVTCSTQKAANEPGTYPAADSPCGIYAYKTPLYALDDIDRFCYRGTLLGKVHLWGVIQKHQYGYRAQFAYPVSLNIGICCICKKPVNLKSEQFTIGWTYYHFTDDFSVNGMLCEVCNEKYYSLEATYSYRELEVLADRYGIEIE
jgi:hypothetical protein